MARIRCTGSGGSTVNGARPAVAIVPGPSLAVSGEETDFAAAAVSFASIAGAPLGSATDDVPSSSSWILLLALSVTGEAVIMR
jgi:hypothetical protein